MIIPPEGYGGQHPVGPSNGLQEQEERIVGFRLRLESVLSPRLSDAPLRRIRVLLASISFQGIRPIPVWDLRMAGPEPYIHPIVSLPVTTSADLSRAIAEPPVHWAGGFVS